MVELGKFLIAMVDPDHVELPAVRLWRLWHARNAA